MVWLNVCNKTNQCICIQYVLSHITNYQHVSIDFAIIIRVVLQEYQKDNKLPNCTSGTIERYEKCLILSNSQTTPLVIHTSKESTGCVLTT